MERYSSFEKLKERANASLAGNHIAATPEKAITSFIDLLRVSVVPANRSATVERPVRFQEPDRSK